MVALAAFAASAGEEKSPGLVTACEVLSNPTAYDGAPVSLLGRISRRDNGRWIGQDGCGSQPDGAADLAIRFDRQAGPLPPEGFAINAILAKSKFRQIAEHTVLRDFRFGSGDYDRWAIVFGRVELDKSVTSQHPSAIRAAVVCRGEALIFLWGGALN